MSVKISVRVKKLSPEAILPKYSHGGGSGDLAADLFALQDLEVTPGDVVQANTGICIELPDGYGALVEDRSGLASMGLTTLGGVIDTGYRGEVKVILANVGRQTIKLHKGDRIAQLRIVARIEADYVEVVELSSSSRGEKGFGSTGS